MALFNSPSKSGLFRQFWLQILLLWRTERHMDSKPDIWTEFLDATSNEESKKETNLVILGNWSFLNVLLRRKYKVGVFGTAGLPAGNTRSAADEEERRGHHELHVHDRWLPEPTKYERRFGARSVVHRRLSGCRALLCCDERSEHGVLVPRHPADFVGKRDSLCLSIRRRRCSS